MTGREFLENMVRWVEGLHPEDMSGEVRVGLDSLGRLASIAQTLSHLELDFDRYGAMLTHPDFVLAAGAGPAVERLEDARAVLGLDDEENLDESIYEIEGAARMAGAAADVLEAGMDAFGPKWIEDVMLRVTRRRRRLGGLRVRVEWKSLDEQFGEDGDA